MPLLLRLIGANGVLPFTADGVKRFISSMLPGSAWSRFKLEGQIDEVCVNSQTRHVPVSSWRRLGVRAQVSAVAICALAMHKLVSSDDTSSTKLGGLALRPERARSFAKVTLQPLSTESTIRAILLGQLLSQAEVELGGYMVGRGQRSQTPKNTRMTYANLRWQVGGKFQM